MGDGLYSTLMHINEGNAHGTQGNAPTRLNFQHSILLTFELFSTRKSLIYFFLGLLISSSSVLLSLFDSDYELYFKTQKPFFILKESSKLHNIKLPS